MKKILLITTACLTLSACESMNDLSWPTMPSMDIFSKKTVEKETPTTETKTPIEINQSALDTELSEMHKLTGYAPRFNNPPAMKKIIEPELKAEVQEPIESAKITEAQSVVKPTAPKVEKTQKRIETKEEIEVIEPATQAVKKDIEVTKPVTQIIQKQETIPTPPPIEPVAIKTPKATAPIQTNETPLFTDADLKLSSTNGCPKIEIMPAARSMTYFENEIAGNLLARAIINEIRGGCEITSRGMELDIDILMNGRITNKGRFEGKKDQEAFMTFPYFVSVMTPQGLPVDKKIMATAMRFRPSVDHLDHAEKITQFIPMENTTTAGQYKIVVGFQLTRKQLEYNRAQSLMKADNIRVAPDLIHRPRRSTNPLAE